MDTEHDDEEIEIDCDFTDQPTCPACGYEVRDVWEYDGAYKEDEPVEMECGNDKCGRTFRSTCSVSYSFCTELVDVEAERAARAAVAAELERERLERIELARKLPPGTAVFVLKGCFAGRSGEVANAEITRDGFLRVCLRGSGGHVASVCIDPERLEASR